ncbi:hypothetical protein [Cellulomonas sp. Leaf395]|uniref:hypothetical protein n=1 Tax=Cellulomonas sp. Leaf395 TaxID=1736362 RepID=UPI0006F21EE5|nr:hypothetical protein [Cellulomonas sp. Leaf395]KQS99738.1 hypothetical protein ASG23_10375 [Cellulomonas sp. Leaf395]
MKRHILAGVVLALLTTAIVLFSGPELQGVALLGAALGGALGLVPDRSPAQRAAGFAVGFLAAWLGYALRAAVLPDAAAGRALAVLVVVLACLAVAGLTRGRLPLWSALLGAAAMAGAYEATYAADPASFVTSSATTATSILLAAGAGFFATSLLGVVVVQEREQERAAETGAESPLFAPVDPPVGEYEGAGNHASARPYTALAVEAPSAPRRGMSATRPVDPQEA